MAGKSNAGRKPTVVEGRTLRAWASKLRLCLPRIYQLHQRGELVARINGTWVDKSPTARDMYGKTAKEWAKELNWSPDCIRKWFREGTLKKIHETGKVPERRPNRRMIYVRGMTMNQLAEHFGVSRQRVHQYRVTGTLEARLDGTYVPKPSTGRPADKTLYAAIVAEYKPDKSAGHLADRMGVSVSVARNALRWAGIKLQVGKARHDAVVAAFKSGMSVREVAAHFDYETKYVYRILNDSGISVRKYKEQLHANLQDLREPGVRARGGRQSRVSRAVHVPATARSGRRS